MESVEMDLKLILLRTPFWKIPLRQSGCLFSLHWNNGLKVCLF